MLNKHPNAAYHWTLKPQTDIPISLTYVYPDKTCPDNKSVPLCITNNNSNSNMWTTGIILQLGLMHLPRHPMVSFMVKSVFVPSLTVGPRGTKELSGLPPSWASFDLFQQTSMPQLIGMIKAPQLSLNLSNAALTSDCWICMEPSLVQYYGIILSPSLFPPKTSPDSSSSLILGPVSLWRNASNPLAPNSRICATNDTYLACTQCVIPHKWQCFIVKPFSGSSEVLESAISTPPC
ncbi:uncharacterized protein LOC129145904 [Talpa occidentalis]|uniref:uncharacterized protein LOC129145904 n=1 Tax=Talpa occidentalis TaxID=50954 RepID=UPI0023F7DC15|nr:uncharacterized protein LOC129145904 [Talpa occidentalis]